MKVHMSTAELKTEDTGASLALGPRTSSLLPGHGFQTGGDVLVRLTRGKMEVRPIQGKKDLQQQVRDLTEDVGLLEDQIQSLIATLPEVPDAMAAHRIPFSLEADLRAILEIVLTDDLSSAAERLRKAAEVTPEQLQEEWEKEHGEGRKG